LNDFFTPKGTGVTSYQMKVFDSNGKQIFSTTNLYNGWDGRVQGGSSGLVCPEGNYLYNIQVSDSCGFNHQYTGNIILMK
jgi:gliding motility-associated-like protein